MTPTHLPNERFPHFVDERYGTLHDEILASKPASPASSSPSVDVVSSEVVPAAPAPRPARPATTRPRSIGRPMSWVQEAACAGQPGIADHTSGPKVQKALALCAGCPVIAECSAWADTQFPYFDGVAGGRIIQPRARKSISSSRSAA